MPGPYAFKQIFAADPSNTSNVAKGGSVLLFAVGDASKKPLVLTDLANGMVLPNPVPINSNGFGPAFLHETLPQVAWEGGGFSGTFESFEGLRADAVAAVAASQASAQAAGDALQQAKVAADNAAAGAAGALAGAVAEATAAKTAAQQAAGLVGAPAGAAVLAAIQPGGAAHGALSGTIGAHGMRAESFFSRLDLRDPSALVVAGAGDSTTDSAGEYLETGFKELMASRYPERPAGVRRYDKGADTLGAYSQWQSGETPGTPGGTQTNVALGSDSFSRTATELVGSMPDLGSAAWEGNSNAFEITGSRVNYSNTTGGSPFAAFKIQNRSGLKIDVAATMRMAFNLGINTQTRLTVGRGAGTTANRLDINVAGTASTTTTLRKNIGGITTTLATFPAGTIPNSSGPADYDFRIAVTNAGGVTATANGQTVTFQLEAEDIAALTGDTWVGFSSYNAEFEADNITAVGDITMPPSDPKPSTLGALTVYNGGYAGGRASHQIDKFAAMYPVRPDLFLICHGHNYSTVDSTPEAFIAAIEALVTKLHATYPGVPVGFVSQSPETVAAGSRTAEQVAQHLNRQIAMRTHCKNRGWVYIPGMEAFAALADGGASKVNADGVHIEAATGAPTNRTGGRIMADALKTWAAAYSSRPAAG